MKPLHVPDHNWSDPRWQQRNAVTALRALRNVFPALSDEQVRLAEKWQRRGLRFALTPYVLSLVELDSMGNPKPDDPIWRQFFPSFGEASTTQAHRPDEYSPAKENWEVAEEMLTSIVQWKYDNRAILYVAESCLTYCTYCLRSLQSTAPAERHSGPTRHWQQTMDAIRQHPEIEEVILSGGDPFVFSNKTIDGMLRDIRNISSVKAIRIHTRALTHNPFRIDEAFCELLRVHEVTEMGIHISHPREMTGDFQSVVERIRASKSRTMLMAQIPLIKGVNDDAEVLRQLCMDLYLSGIKPYYLLHNMPNTPAAVSQRTSVRRGVELMSGLRRHMSNPAVPEYILAHRTGKITVPLEINGTPEFLYTKDQTGYPIIRFRNWKGDWVEYLDAP